MGEKSISGNFIDFETLILQNSIQEASDIIIEANYGDFDFMRKDVIDRFLDFVYIKVQTGYWETFNDAYPFKRMNNLKLEEKVKEMINVHLYPDIMFKLLKFFTRNIYDSDSNLFIANLIYSKDIIRSIYETYVLFRKDIFAQDKEKRILNVKRIQQFSHQMESELSSPLGAAAILKYVLEFLSIKNNLDDIFSKEDLLLSGNTESAGKTG